MNQPATLLAMPEGLTGLGPRGAFRRALERINWRTVMATLAIALAVEAWQVYEFLGDPSPVMPAWEVCLSATIINLCMAFSIMVATLVADEFVALGAKRIIVYACALIVGSLAGALAQQQAHHWLHLRALTNDVPRPGSIYDMSSAWGDVSITQPAVMFFEYLIWGSVIIFIYVNRRTALLAAAGMNAAQVKRAQAQRRTLESRLQALQARIEPQFLFTTLAHVRDLYDSEPASGGRMLDDLIAYLRAALPHLRESTSTLRQELELVSAYLRIMRARLCRRLAFEIDAPQMVLYDRVPSMTLLPLVSHVVANIASLSTGGVIRITARRLDAVLRLEISGGGAPVGEGSNEVLRDIRERLHGLYGGRGRLDCGSTQPSDARIVMELPYERPDGSPR